VTVFVDTTLPHGGSTTFRWKVNCHLFSDSLDPAELHAMADAIGLKRSWFQTKPGQPWFDHYDLTEAKRALAVKRGATEVSWRDWPHTVIAKRQQHEEARKRVQP
jgi:uncharacterized protein DUF4031